MKRKRTPELSELIREAFSATHGDRLPAVDYLSRHLVLTRRSVLDANRVFLLEKACTQLIHEEVRRRRQSTTAPPRPADPPGAYGYPLSTQQFLVTATCDDLETERDLNEGMAQTNQTKANWFEQIRLAADCSRPVGDSLSPKELSDLAAAVGLHI